MLEGKWNITDFLLERNPTCPHYEHKDTRTYKRIDLLNYELLQTEHSTLSIVIAMYTCTGMYVCVNDSEWIKCMVVC